MTERRRPAETSDGEHRVFLGIVDALKRNPPYLLIFAVILLNYFFCIAYLARAWGNNPLLDELVWGGLILLAIVAVGMVVVIEQQSARRKSIKELRAENADQAEEIERLRADLRSADRHDINLPDAEIRDHLQGMVENVRNALRYDNDVFREEIAYEIAGYKNEAGRWAGGTLHTDGNNYERILRSFYLNARHSVLATSNQDYMEFWANREKAEQVLRAHRRAYDLNKVVVTRIFVFAGFDQVTERDLDIIRHQEREIYIKAKVFIANENAPFAGQLLNDFVVIDRDRPSQAIGITSAFQSDAMSARWVFADDPDVERAATYIETNSLTIQEIEQRLQRE